MMECAQVGEWLSRDLDGAAEPSGDVAAHLERCAACRGEAGRLKALAAAARAALPAAAVPPDFAGQVMAALLEPSADARLAEAARPRVRRWLPVVVAALVVAALVPFLPPAAAVRGDLRVARDGGWVEAGAAAYGDTFGLDALAEAARGGLRVKALTPSVLLAARPLELRGGRVLLETDEPALLRTALAEVRLGPGSACVVDLDAGKGDTMSFARMNRLAPTALAVTMLAGGAVVVNAQGEEEAAPGQRINVLRGRPPVLDGPAVERELDRVLRTLEEANRSLDELRRQIALAEKRADELRMRPGPREVEERARRFRKDARRVRKDEGRRGAGVPDEVLEEPMDRNEIESPAPPRPELSDLPFRSGPRLQRARWEALVARARKGNAQARQEVLEEWRRTLERLRAIDEALDAKERGRWEAARREYEEARRRERTEAEAVRRGREERERSRADLRIVAKDVSVAELAANLERLGAELVDGCEALAGELAGLRSPSTELLDHFRELEYESWKLARVARELRLDEETQVRGRTIRTRSEGVLALADRLRKADKARRRLLEEEREEDAADYAQQVTELRGELLRFLERVMKEEGTMKEERAMKEKRAMKEER